MSDIQYLIKLAHKGAPNGYLCGDGKFIAGFCSGMGLKSTLRYKRRGWAERKLRQVQSRTLSPIEIEEVRPGV